MFYFLFIWSSAVFQLTMKTLHLAVALGWVAHATYWHIRQGRWSSTALNTLALCLCILLLLCLFQSVTKLEFVSIAFCCCDKDHSQKQLEEETVYFILRPTAHHEGMSEQKLKAGTEADRTTGYWLTLYGLLSLGLCAQGQHCPHWAEPIVSSKIIRKSGQSDERILQMIFCFPRWP